MCFVLAIDGMSREVNLFEINLTLIPLRTIRSWRYQPLKRTYSTSIFLHEHNNVNAISSFNYFLLSLRTEHNILVYYIQIKR